MISLAQRASPAPSPSALSAHERGILAAVAATALPPGRIFPGAGEAAARRLDAALAGLGEVPQKACKALLWALESSALVLHRRQFVHLDPKRQLALLESWRNASYPRRSAARALLAAIKLVHFNDPGMYRKIGCVYGIEPPSTIERPRWMQRVTAAEALGPEETIECDVAVVGTGAGGAVVASELAERGLAVVMIEEGHYHNRSEFNGQGAEMQRKLYRDMGATFAFGNALIPIPTGKAVGGTTTINGGTCYRVPARVLAHWREEFGLSELTPDALAPHFEKVERDRRAETARAELLGGVARLIARGCDALGYRHTPLRRNAPDCDGKGVCCFGCPTDAKRSTNVSYVPRALRAGAQLLTGLHAEEITTAGGRASGLCAWTADRRTRVRL